MDSQDKERHRRNNKKHPMTNFYPHPPHKTIPNDILPKHHPHKHPPEFDLNIDHGNHEDRPRPGKLMKKFK